MLKVILKLDVYKHTSNEERFWERQVWIGQMSDKGNGSACDPLVLIKEYENGSEHILFRVEDYKDGQVSYRPTILHSTDPFLKSLPKFGFKMEPVVNVEPV